MRHLTAKQRKFVIAYVRTGQATASAIEAGYAPADARSRACKLLKNDAVQSEIKRLSRLADEGQPVGRPTPPAGDPLDYLRNVMNDHLEDPRLRLDAATTLAQYLHPKPGTRGAKASREEAAKKPPGAGFDLRRPLVRSSPSPVSRARTHPRNSRSKGDKSASAPVQ